MRSVLLPLCLPESGRIFYQETEGQKNQNENKLHAQWVKANNHVYFHIAQIGTKK